MNPWLAKDYRWVKRTPAMAAGLTSPWLAKDWSVMEVLCFKTPPPPYEPPRPKRRGRPRRSLEGLAAGPRFPGDLPQDMGAVEKALPFAEACLALGEFDVSHSVRYVLADIHLKQGRLDQAQALAERVLAADSSANLRSYVYALLAEIHHRAGRHDGAVATVAQGFALAADIGLPANRCVLALAGVRYGNVAQRRRARKMLSALDLATVPAYLQADAREALERGGPGTPS